MFHLKGNCRRSNCQFRHTRKEKAIVCKHWLRGLCKKGDAQCEFLHEYDMSKMPICQFFSSDGSCSNEDCIFRHVDATAQLGECPWYARGFCRRGKQCHYQHVKKEACLRYITGFCPKGSKCEFGHPKYEDPPEEQSDRRYRVVCRTCNQSGHRDYECPSSGGSSRGPRPNQSGDGNSGEGRGTRKPLAEVLCFKCKQTGHYANKCPNQAVRDASFDPAEYYKQKAAGATVPGGPPTLGGPPGSEANTYGSFVPPGRGPPPGRGAYQHNGPPRYQPY